MEGVATQKFQDREWIILHFINWQYIEISKSKQTMRTDEDKISCKKLL